MIEGVSTKQLKVIPDERGRLMEILRFDDLQFSKFGQIYMTTTYPGVVKAWHKHEKQIDNVTCILGMIKLVLYDPRKVSQTFGQIDQICMGGCNPMLVQIPHGAWHGWMCVSVEEAIIINVPTEEYNYRSPDEQRLDPHDNNIPYEWDRKDG